MQTNRKKNADSLLLNFRKEDGPDGICAETFERLCEVEGMNKTALVHRALAFYAQARLTTYQADDGPLSDAQIAAIRQAAGITDFVVVDSLLF